AALCSARGQADHDACPAGDVEHSFLWPQRNSVEKVSRPNRRDRRHEIAFVKLGRAGIQLPVLVTCHDVIPSSDTPADTARVAAERYVADPGREASRLPLRRFL